MNYQEAIDFIHSVEWQGSRPGLSRITELLSRLGNPQKGLRVIHVAGTNGKGSFCAMLESVLRAAGYRTGLFVSPFIEHFEERVQCGGALIEPEELAEIVTEIAPVCRSMEDLPTEFEILTAIGFTYFKKKQVDVAVVECGMGGRLDSTNVIEDPLLTVITGISLDHVAFLGDTVAKIAAEKAGILKADRPILYGGKDEEARAVIRAHAEELGCPYFEKDFTAIENVSCTLDGTRFDYQDHKDVALSLLGTYQPENAASVLEAVGILRNEGLTIPDDAIRQGLASVRWKGRFEKLSVDPTVIFDGGHNEEGVTAAVKTVRACFGGKKPVIISGVMRDKDYRKIASELASVARTVYTVTPDNPRALPSEDYAAVFEELGVTALPCPDFHTAVKKAYAAAKAEGCPLLCCGSLYAYRDFKASLSAIAKEETRRIGKAKAKNLVIALAVLFVVLVVLNLLADGTLLKKLFSSGNEQKRPAVELCDPDWEEDIFTDEDYLGEKRYVLYKDGAQAITLANENDVTSTGEAAAFFYRYFDAVIHGNADAVNAMLTEEFAAQNGLFEAFTMQKIYDIEVDKLGQFVLNQGTAEATTVYEFDVSYRIKDNNGTFRDDLNSGAARPQIYQLYVPHATGEVRLQSISEYNIKT
ncbi:MAG: bifunctional folylpolyglutamate synthase/dihydrofolate synthase [Clostridia bacterium]|nr:bifunctional folylpolyglutamate synthase/dihydrofolate synthase [Clostridia bacterium]